ncbi:hypothetical protein B0H14DRAFT_2593607 [Mycena olivaceomarginata]|nr:hypothetical protein B0H14DRAFT_2593607 [Mycena olivaceomarginata]
MDSNVPYIRLKTPPPSPGLQRIQLGIKTPSQVTTPTRKRWQEGKARPGRKQNTRQPIEDNIMQEAAPDWDSASAGLDVGTEPVWDSLERLPQSAETNLLAGDARTSGLGYSEYCDSIQEEGGAFYQIGTNFFVVNGWDPQKKISKVVSGQSPTYNIKMVNPGK